MQHGQRMMLAPLFPTLTDPSRNVFIPNAFTPNKDGHNDEFNIKVGKDIIGIEMSIFNRFGNKVYQTNNINAGGMDNTKTEIVKQVFINI